MTIKEYTEIRKQEIKELVSKFDQAPQVAIFQVGDNEASNRYVRNKVKDCGDGGIIAHWYKFETDISEEDFLAEILETQEHYDGIMVQLPLPPHISFDKVKDVIKVAKDVDGFCLGSHFDPCTPKGIVDWLERTGVEIAGKHVVIIGRSEIVGKPLAKMMLERNATVTVCHSKTKELWKHLEIADLIVCAVGKAKFLNCYSIHVPVIDVGINFDENGKMVGDCFNTEGREVTPVPGGVGLLTRLALLENVVKAKENS